MLATFKFNTDCVPVEPQYCEGVCCKCQLYIKDKTDAEGHSWCIKYNMYTSHDRTCKSFKMK